MKLKIRTLSNTEIEIDVPHNALVSEVKKKIEEVLTTMDATRQMLIYQGKILNDSMRLSDYPNIKEADKLVVMLPKAKQTPSPGPTTRTENEAAPSIPPSADTQSSSTDLSSVPTPAPSFSSTPAAPSPPSDTAAQSAPVVESSSPTTVAPESTLVVGPELEQTISDICAMGFERDQVIRALHAAFNNPDRAVEYLTSGIPSTPQEEPRTITSQSQQPTEPSERSTATPAAEGTPISATNLSVLRQHPLFEQIRAALQANPQLLPGMLQMISTQNPELAELIVNNQVEFLQMMSEGTEGSAGGLGGPVTIQVTPEQQEKVQHLQALGFPEGAAVQALVVCEWDEDRAANFLFDNAGDFDEADEDDAAMS